MLVKDVCSCNVISITETASLRDACKLMSDKRIGALVVLNSLDKPAGILTDRDIALSPKVDGSDFGQLKVKDVMTKNPVIVNPQKTIFEAIKIMRSKDIRRILIVDEKRKDNLVGILSIDDIISLLADELNELSELVKHQCSCKS